MSRQVLSSFSAGPLGAVGYASSQSASYPAADHFRQVAKLLEQDREKLRVLRYSNVLKKHTSCGSNSFCDSSTGRPASGFTQHSTRQESQRVPDLLAVECNVLPAMMIDNHVLQRGECGVTSPLDRL